MSMNAAIAQLTDARKVMHARWQVVTRKWRDPTSKRFEETFINVIDRDLQKTITGLNQTMTVIQKVRQDCS